ncbi:OmpW/AlkL family protein [Stenotrophomonas mori]|uniref:Outer membrane beta-barrel protein n=1 Tax=Stenotrophomonas mori TaxID=2871096 RepID=A0ABT0SJJ2_9GAMM|nr:OmpW family outer membrane protein [Stenotrophomonas mori]MCL7715281.1 outer membrane beta-barrel protein [Stenotrophomonas mori]
MRSIKTLSFAVLGALALAPTAFAQDAGTDTASGKHFAIVGGATLLQPKSNPGNGIDKFDGGPAPTVSASYFFNDNIAVELWGAADKFDHRVRANGGGKVGTVEQQPVALSAQYHFGGADNVFRPFVGAGYYQSNFSNEKIDGLDASGDHVSLRTAKGAIGTLGVDMNINSTWFARADARYMRSRPELNVGGAGTGDTLKLDPWTVGFGIGARF